MIQPLLPKDYIKISFSKSENTIDTRILKIEVFGQKFENYI